MGSTISRLLCHLIGHFYPAYKTYKAIELNSEPLYTQWLTYWLVNTCFSLLELFSDTLFPIFLPFYFELKILVLIYLVSPQFLGATKLCNLILLPHLSKYEDEIDRSVLHLQKTGAEKLSEISKKGVNHLQTSGINLITSGLSVMASLQETAELNRRESVAHNVGRMGNPREDARYFAGIEPTSDEYRRVALEARSSFISSVHED
eukprot:snap_masked-scaffold_131-processed-gene-0.3-mRNA-1 protein AED:0.30 eAED:0.45 QI:0/-1/0/1/-1/1/1/0/204